MHTHACICSFREYCETEWHDPEVIKRNLLVWWGTYKNTVDAKGNRLMCAGAFKLIENALKRIKDIKNFPGASISLGPGGPYGLDRKRSGHLSRMCMVLCQVNM